MTGKKKAGWTGITLAGLVAFAVAWPQIQPVADWALRNLGIILGRDQVQAVMVASAIGVFVNASLPHALPGKWSPGLTKGLAGWTGFALTLAAALALVPTRVGFVYAMLAASATPSASQAVMGLLYWLKPCARPASLKP